MHRGRSSHSRIIIRQLNTPCQHQQQQHQHYQQEQHQNHYENQHQSSHSLQNFNNHKTEVAIGVVAGLGAGTIPNITKIKAQSYSVGTNSNDRGVAFSKVISCNNQTLILPSSGISQETLNQSVGSSRANSLPRPLSPSPSISSEKNDAGDPHVSRRF